MMQVHLDNTYGQDDRARERLDRYLSEAGRSPRAERERVERVQRLNALEARSDRELRARGLTRGRIASFVFRDLFDI